MTAELPSCLCLFLPVCCATAGGFCGMYAWRLVRINVFLVQFVNFICCFCCHCNSSCKEFTVKNSWKIRLQGALKNCLVCHLVPRAFLHLYYSWYLFSIDVYFKISSDDDCFSRQTALCSFFGCDFLYIVGVFFCNVLFLWQNLTGLNEMPKWISLHPICKVRFCFH